MYINGIILQRQKKICNLTPIYTPHIPKKNESNDNDDAENNCNIVEDDKNNTVSQSFCDGDVVFRQQEYLTDEVNHSIFIEKLNEYFFFNEPISFSVNWLLLLTSLSSFLLLPSPSMLHFLYWNMNIQNHLVHHCLHFHQKNNLCNCHCCWGCLNHLYVVTYSHCCCQMFQILVIHIFLWVFIIAVSSRTNLWLLSLSFST